ncbi:hypothetical protein DM02DRAFT_635943 [Periconia macrospinosa]|uniref:Uncharacterized protein n=1 Tax=Periconia macrospinosa TaxID=97972 RepID=A0A2V1D392_9PLEO|nr:hypothetical protein DM02DRAFT_635943 [Periconia macrospinosa]
MSKALNRRSASLSSYKAFLDELLDAGSSGVTLEPWKHLPHLETIPSFGPTDTLVALPGVLVDGCVHIAAIYGASRIRYSTPQYVAEAMRYAQSHWQTGFACSEPGFIEQRRDPNNECTWRVFSKSHKLLVYSAYGVDWRKKIFKSFRAVPECHGITYTKFNTMDELRLRIQHSILLKIAQMENTERGFSKALEEKREKKKKKLSS